MTLTLVKEPSEFVLDADATHGDALRTPGPAVVGCEDLRGPEDVVEIVHRFSLTHEDDIRQLVALWQRVDLIQDISCCEIALKALFTRLTEKTVHLAAHLAGDAECGAVVIWDKDSFYELLGIRVLRMLRVIRSSHRKEILDGTVFRALAVDGRHSAYLIFLFQFLAVDLRDIGHLVDTADVLLIEPFGYLRGCEGRHTKLTHDDLQFAECLTNKHLLFTVHSGLFLRIRVQS